MAHAHFKDKLLNDLLDKSPPFRCPAPDCNYQTRERDKWGRHYGSVHGLIKKYLQQYFEENPNKIPFSMSSGTINISADDTSSGLGNLGKQTSSTEQNDLHSVDQKVQEKVVLKV